MDRDPWDWDVADVQQFFRQDAARFLTDRPGGQLPHLDPFLRSFSDNDVDGASLLDTVDGPALRDDFGITSFRIRGSILHCIRKLQNLSQAHRSHILNLRPETPASLNIGPSQFPGPETPKDVLPTIEIGENVRSGEFAVQDAHGRKRRKLDLSNAQPEIQQAAAEDFGQKADAPGYLPTAALPIDELFYGSTALGNEIKDLPPTGNVLINHEDLDTADDNFQFTLQGKRPGEAEFVHSRMRHFLTNAETVELRRRDRIATGIMPYQDGLQSKARCATVVHIGKEDDEYVATREQAALLQSGYDFSGLGQESTGEWDFLLQRQKHGNDDDEELPPYGDSSGELEITDSEAGTRDDNAEEASEDTDEAVDQVRIADAVDQYIAAHMAEWQEIKLPRLEQKRAWTVWKRMKQSRNLREMLISSAQANVDKFTERLAKLKKDLVAQEWSSDNAVSKACGNLDPTIEDREEQRWMISVWQRRKEPAHVPQHNHTTNALQTPATATAPIAKVVVHPDDRMSVSPSRAMRVEMKDDAEEFHTPEGSTATSPAADPDGFEASVELSLELDQPAEDHASQRSNADTRDIFEASDGMDDFLAHSDTQTQDGFVITSSPPRGSTDPGSAKRSTIQPSSSPVAVESLGTVQAASSDDELPSPSTFVPKKIVHNPRLGTPTKKLSTGMSTQPIDLTGLSSDSAGPVSARSKKLGIASASVTPKKGGRASASAKKPLSYDFNSCSEEASAAQVDTWDYDELKSRGDRQRILIKMLRDAGRERRDDLHHRLSANRKKFQEGLHAAIRGHTEGNVTSADELMAFCATVSMAWYTSDPKFMDEDEKQMPWVRLAKDPSQIEQFVQMLGRWLRLKSSRLFEEPKATAKTALQPDPSSVTIISSSNTQRMAQHTPHKRRKREVLASQSAIKSRRNAHERREQYREALESQAAESSQIAAMDSSVPSKSHIAINPARKEKQDPIFIHPKIAKKMKAHQIDGVCFLWREVTAVDDEDGAQGCLLAHTMGLGKTMQTIALLVALSEASTSPNQRVSSQLPEHLRLQGIRDKRQLRMLVICPPGLLQNWRDELNQWAPKTLPNIFVVEASSKARQMSEIEDWYKVGGVLLIGYKLLHLLVNWKSEKQQELDGDLIDEMLLQGPEIVVADEAHSLKNPATGVSQAASRFKTHTRIALTGTPMSNDVDEIYALVSWVAPDYLGDPQWFRANFAEPIKEGTYEESSRYERRKSLIKLQVLHHDIAPKVDRADITALRGSLKSKTEFLITVNLTNTQETLYQRYITALLGGGENKEANQMRIFSWLGLLMLLTNHPAAFRRKLLMPAPPKKSKKGAAAAITREGTPAISNAGSNATAAPAVDTTAEQVIAAQAAMKDPEEEDLFTLGFTQDMVDRIIEGFEDDTVPELSAKMPIFLSILDLSFRCNDKVLVFSGSIPTMNYIGELFNDQDIAYGRIDGQTPTAKRMQIIDAFHNNDFNVLIVSTRAGGVGLNIQGANRVVILDFSFNPTWEEQAIGRAYRLGQTKQVFVYRFIAGGTFETNIHNKQLFKMSLTQRVVDKKNPRRNAQRHTREYLYDPKPVRQDNIAKWIGKDPSVLDVILKQHSEGHDTRIRSIQTTETLEEDAQDEPLDEEERKLVDEEIQLGRFKQRGRTALAGLPPLSTAVATGVSVGRVMGAPAATQAFANRPNVMPDGAQIPQADPSVNGASAAPLASAPPCQHQRSSQAGLPEFRPLPPGQ